MSTNPTSTSGGQPTPPPLYVVLGTRRHADEFARRQGLHKRDVITHREALTRLRGLRRPVVPVDEDVIRPSVGEWRIWQDVLQIIEINNKTLGQS